MAIRRSPKFLEDLKKSPKFKRITRQNSRRLNLEKLEDRRLMVTGPTLAALATNAGIALLSDTSAPLVPGKIVQSRPTELDFTFAAGQKINAATLSTGLKLIGAGGDGKFGTADDIKITPGYAGILDDPRQVVMRFAQDLPDDAYQITVVGTGTTPLKDQFGKAFNGGVDEVITFTLNAGAQVQAVIPQPVTRDANTLLLKQAQDTIDVYFNNDQLKAVIAQAGSVKNPAYYQLIDTAAQAAALPAVTLPTTVDYTFIPATATTVATNKATLHFATSIPQGTYKLQVGSVVAPSTSIGSAVHLGGPVGFTGALNPAVQGYIGDNPNLSGAQANDVDLYRFDLPVASSFIVTLNSSVSLIGALRLFDSLGNPLQLVTSAGGITTLNAGTLAAGTYYIGVSDKSNVAYSAKDGTGATGGLTTGAYTLSTNNFYASLNLASDQTAFLDATANSNLGILGQSGALIGGSINTLAYNNVWTGANDTPGHRNIPDENHFLGGPASGTSSISSQSYNFRDNYGSDPTTGLPLHNAITENQKADARAIFQLYSRYLGVEFTETPSSGINVATGDLRAAKPTIPTGVGGLGGGGFALMNANIDWGDSPYGGSWFTVAMHEIGHALGLGHAYDLPPLTIQGGGETSTSTAGAEAVFPGDNDILDGQTLYRPASRDIDLYKFNLTEPGEWTAETVAQRLANTSLLDSVITVYQESTNAAGALTRTVIARNDDYYGKDSFVDLHLATGTYYVAVTSKGNTAFDPTVPDTGLGGTTEGAFNLKLNFTPDAQKVSIVDASGTPIDGNSDGQPGGTFQFWFQSGPTIFVDKSNTAANPDGTLGNPFTLISDALAASQAALAVQINAGVVNPVEQIRIEGNTGVDGKFGTSDDKPYLVGLNYDGTALPDGQLFQVPQGVTLQIDAGAVLKFRKANIDIGSSSQGIDRSHGAIQVLGTPSTPAYFTSFANDALGGDSNGTTAPAPEDWGGIVIRADSDYDHQANPVYLNVVNHADLSYGGGKVIVDSVESVFNPIHLISSRPTIDFNRITHSADAAMSADPNSFDDSLGRLGPDIHNNLFVDALLSPASLNSVNGLLVRIRTQFGNPVDILTVNGRFHSTDIVYVIPEDLYINGSPGGPIQINGVVTARPSARLLVDPGVIVKMSGSRIEARIGSQLIAEGTAANPVTFTALADNRYGDGGTFQTQNSGNNAPPSLTPQGLWSGLFFGADTEGSLDHVNLLYAGGVSPIEGGFATFSPIEIHQGDVRIANSFFQYNANGQGAGGNRNGRGDNSATGGATIFVRGAQPIVVNNIIRDNAGQVMSVNANAMTVTLNPDYGPQNSRLVFDSANPNSTTNSYYPQFADNEGPLVRLNRLVDNGASGLEIRGGTLTAATAWDDTDIAHILRNEIVVPNFDGVGGLTIKSAPNESLVVKASGASAGLTASGTLLDINDRIGGALYMLGQPGRPVIFTSLADDTVSAGLQPLNDLPLFDTNNDGIAGSTPGAVLPKPGDWRGLKLDQLSNDRNVTTVYETESVFAGQATTHGDPLHAQFLGNLAPDLKSGDDNRKLGFEVHGNIALNNSQNVDVYSFTADSGTEVWINLDNTSPSLQGIVELVNANGDTLARSVVTSPDGNAHTFNTLTGLAATMNKDPINLGRDSIRPLNDGNYYSLNPLDPGFRVTLPGTNLKGQTYFIRVRSQKGPGEDGNFVASASTDFATGGQVNVTFTAKAQGNAGSGVTLTFSKQDLGVNGLPNITVSGNSIAVALNNNVANPTTYQQLINTINGNLAAKALVSAASTGPAGLLNTSMIGQPLTYSPVTLTTGLTSGHYQLNLRLRQMDEIAGSQIRYTNVGYATTGIDVIGLPLHSFLTGESTNGGNGNSNLGGAQGVGNLLTADRNSISISGSLSNQADVQWYEFNVDYNLIQSIGGVSDGKKTWSTTFDIDYADGLARPNTTLSVFDADGTLIYTGRDSNVGPDQPQPGKGTDTPDQTRGSVGASDAFIGPVQLPTGNPGSVTKYFVAVSSNRMLPKALDATFNGAGGATPLVRLEPVDSVQRIIDDHINSSGGDTASKPVTTAFSSVKSVANLNTYVAPYNLSDVQLFMANNGGGFGIVDPYAPPSTAHPIINIGTGGSISDLAMRDDGFLYGWQDTGGSNSSGQLVRIDPGTGALTVIGPDGIPKYDPNTKPPDPNQDTRDTVTAIAWGGHVSQGSQSLYYAVTDMFDTSVSRLYRADPNNGSAAEPGSGFQRVGNVITGNSTAFAIANFGGIASVTVTSIVSGSAGNGIQVVFNKVNNSALPAATATISPGRVITVTVNAASRPSSVSNDLGSGNTVNVLFTAKAAGKAGDGTTVLLSAQDLGPNAPPTVSVTNNVVTVVINSNATGATTYQQLVDLINGDLAASAVIQATFTSGNLVQKNSAITSGSGTIPSKLVLANGQNPATAADVALAIANAQLNGQPLVTANVSSGTGTVDITGTLPIPSITLGGGTSSGVNLTTGMAFGNDGILYGVSNSGTFYQIDQGSAKATNIVTVTNPVNPGQTLNFSGLARGPQNLYNGVYKDLFFATTTDGTVVALNTLGQTQVVFGDTDAVVPTANKLYVQTGFGSSGLAFSPLDFNLFHTTEARGGDLGHGVNISPDFSRTTKDNPAQKNFGGTSFYFGLEKWNPNGAAYPNGTSYDIPTGSPSSAQYGILTDLYQQDLSANPNIGSTAGSQGGNYNLAGGAHGTMVTNSFSLAGYSASLKPTAYVSYFRDATASVVISISNDNGATYTDITGTQEAFISTSTNDAPANPHQIQQPLYDATGGWRQVRVDLSKFANQDNLRLRVGFASGITDLKHEGFYLDDIIVGFAGRGEMVTGASPGVSDFFQTPTPIPEPGITTLPPTQYLAGPYQVEIRRGAEFGASVNPLKPDIALFQSFDVNDSIILDNRQVTSDNFETGNFNVLPWANASASPWNVNNTANATGVYSAQSGAATKTGGGATTSDLSLTRSTGNGVISFARKVSSVSGSGFLRFYIDGTLATGGTDLDTGATITGQWTGDVTFGTVTFPITQGTHTFKWSYQKDLAAPITSTQILDTSWIDDVSFQPQPVDFESGLPSTFHTSTSPTANSVSYAKPTVGAPSTPVPVAISELPWTTGATPNVAGKSPATGGTSARSALNMNANNTSTLTTTKLVGGGTMTFNAMITNTTGLGTLKFLIDGSTKLTLTGAQAWQFNTATVTAGIHTFAWVYSTNGVKPAAADGAFLDDITFPIANVGAGLLGDQNQYREQGSIVLDSNKVTNAKGIGILVEPGPRGAGGNLPYPASVINGPTLNSQMLAPGIVLVNNVVANYGTVGISFQGDANAGNTPAGAVPFGRIFNNTIYGGATATGIGIQVINNAGPTLLNNIVANAVTGVSIDASSAPDTVVANTLYSADTTNIVFPGGVETSPFVINENPNQVKPDPLFVNPATLNFYLASGSKAIDSAVDKLDDRFTFVAVKSPLGIPQSPIIAPIMDEAGQLRVNDPSKNPLPGTGQNIFKDIGSIDRADFAQPTAALSTPVDNDPAGLDLSPAANVISLNNIPLSKFEIQLSDVGIGIDDGRIKSSQFVITADGKTLVDKVDYTFVYNANKHLVTLLPSSGFWPLNVQYVITIDNSAKTGVTDLAGNTLLPDYVTGPFAGQTVFTIFDGVLNSFGTAPAPYPTLLANNGARHVIVPGMFLGTGVTPTRDGVPTLNPNGDGDGGITNVVLLPNGAAGSSHFDVTASVAGVLNVWVDLNQDGNWTSNEFVVKDAHIGAGVTHVTFQIPQSLTGSTVARFRFTTDSSKTTYPGSLVGDTIVPTDFATPIGLAINGEVEDYQVYVGSTFQNPSNKLDVGGNSNGSPDGFISPVDVLLIVNVLNRFIAAGNGAFIDLQIGANVIFVYGANPPTHFYPFYDVDGNGAINSSDVLAVVNYLNTHPRVQPSGEDSAGSSAGTSQSTAASPAIAAPAAVVGSSSAVTAEGEAAKIPAVVYAGSSIVIEQPAATATRAQIDSQLFGSGGDLALTSSTATLAADALVTGGNDKNAKVVGSVLEDMSFDALLATLATSRPKKA